MPKHDDGCHWNQETEHCTCGALVMAKAYQFDHGGIIAFDQFGKQMPYYQDWNLARKRISQDFPHIHINRGEMVR